MKISMKLVYQYSPTLNHLHPLQVENRDSNSWLVVDEDDGKFRLKRVKGLLVVQHQYNSGFRCRVCWVPRFISPNLVWLVEKTVVSHEAGQDRQDVTVEVRLSELSWRVQQFLRQPGILFTQLRKNKKTSYSSVFLFIYCADYL